MTQGLNHRKSTGFEGVTRRGIENVPMRREDAVMSEAQAFSTMSKRGEEDIIAMYT